MITIGLFVVLTIYWNIVTFAILRDYSTVVTLKDYFRIENRVMIVANVSPAIILLIFIFIHHVFSKV